MKNQDELNKSNLVRWINHEPLPKFDSFESLKNEVENHAIKDYVFFPFLIGYVRRFLDDNCSFQEIKDCTLKVISDLLLENKIDLFYVTSDSMNKAEWKKHADVDFIISRIRTEWENLNKECPDVNEIAWIQAPPEK